MPVLETTCESGQSRRYMLATPAKLAGCKEAPCFYLTLLAVFVLQTGQLVIFVCSPCRTMRYQQVKTSNELFEISLTLKVRRFCIDCARNTTSSRWKHLPRGRIWMHTAAITKCRDNTHHSGIPSAASPTLLYQVPLVLLNFWDVKLWVLWVCCAEKRKWTKPMPQTHSRGDLCSQASRCHKDLEGWWRSSDRGVPKAPDLPRIGSCHRANVWIIHDHSIYMCGVWGIVNLVLISARNQVGHFHKVWYDRVFHLWQSCLLQSKSMHCQTSGKEFNFLLNRPSVRPELFSWVLLSTAVKSADESLFVWRL